MASSRFSSSMCAFLCVLHAITYSSAYALQGSEVHEELLVTRNNVASIQKELVDEVPKAARKMKIGGRKMGLKGELEKEEGLNGETSQISGKDMNVAKGALEGSQASLNVKEISHMLKPHHNKETREVTKSVESERLIDADDDEIVNLMHKDYKGMGKARRKPPINNHEPTN